MYSQSPTYDQNFLKKISIQTTIKMSLKFYFELHFKLCAQTVDYHNAWCWYNGKATYLNPPWPAGWYTFYLISHFQLIRQGAQNAFCLSQGVYISEGLWKEVVIT